MRAASLSNAIRAHRKEVSTVSQPFLPTAPPAGLPAASTVGAKAAVYANVDKRVVSGGAGADGGYMGGATGHAHVAFCLAPRHPPVTPTNQHQARGGRERAREREREREREKRGRKSEHERMCGDAASRERGWATEKHCSDGRRRRSFVTSSSVSSVSSLSSHAATSLTHHLAH